MCRSLYFGAFDMVSVVEKLVGSSIWSKFSVRTRCRTSSNECALSSKVSGGSREL